MPKKYDTAQLRKDAIKAIKEHNLIFIQDVLDMLGISSMAFYTHFPNGSNSLKELHDLIQANRINSKVKLRRKWQDSEAPALQMGLMKLLSNPEELKKLSMEHNVHEFGEDNKIDVSVNIKRKKSDED